MESNWQEIFTFYAEDRNRQYVSPRLAASIESMTNGVEAREKQRWVRIQDELSHRDARILKADSQYKVTRVVEESPHVHVYYTVHIQWQLEQRGHQYEQEWIEQRACFLKEDQGWWVLKDDLLSTEPQEPIEQEALSSFMTYNDSDFWISNPNERRVQYDRGKAVQYAEKWWNAYNPQFEKFEVDCTNFISQCLWAGNAPMKHSSARNKGWWYKFTNPAKWSFSWSVAHSLRWYLSNSRSGMRATEVFAADQLEPGDVICYDFNGDGRWQHNTIVVAKDGVGMPLVNAHTTNSRHRYWNYTDSYAWTEQIAYKFFRIVNQF